MKKSLFLVLLLFGLVGCSGASFEPDTFSVADMCIVHTGSGDKVCYGDNREKAEKVLGRGTIEDPVLKSTYEYERGVTVSYRDDLVAMIVLGPASEGSYETARGASIGILKSAIKDMYGSKYAVDKAERNLAYNYDSSSKKFLMEIMDLEIESREKAEKIYLVSFVFDADGYANKLKLMDYPWAMFLE